MKQHPEYFISCDWGTTNFRLKLVNADTLKVLKGYTSNDGIIPLSSTWGNLNKEEKSILFKKFLIRKIHDIDPECLCKYVVASGMVTSNIGMQEVAYSPFPIDFEGGQLSCVFLEKADELMILLVSGVRGENGMMRGEETQAIGLVEYLYHERSGTLILPGTHSKHIKFSDGQFTGSQNFMTGELFAILRAHSILANSVREAPFEGEVIQAFKDGVTKGYNQRGSSLLFSVRASDVLHGSTKESNFYYLSGLLIGDELSFVNPKDGKIFMAPPNHLYSLYITALEILFDESEYTVLGEEVMDQALLKGHKKLLLKILN